MSRSRNIMIALDHSSNSEAAFRECLETVDKSRDQLYLFTAAERSFVPMAHFHAIALTTINKNLEKAPLDLLNVYAARCAEAGVSHVHMVVGRDSDAGRLICKAVQQKEIDYLYLGRRGTGKISRVFLGSVSRYCLEHAPCNVVVVKTPYKQGPLGEMDAVQTAPVDPFAAASPIAIEQVEPEEHHPVRYGVAQGMAYSAPELKHPEIEYMDAESEMGTGSS
eukprot:TRINITY_DN24787_c0_g1_i1.p1 TRINITY_DN24787_c0_g1~~TRINITY_DN24787_c0_g1_i1.p1  ORF type:complete len:222 (-),score=49.03 TRINITY_DN24787_c0_g1_i1:137-802(-)